MAHPSEIPSDSLTLENQQIISDALDKLNYQENKVARILANGKTEIIGIIIPNLYLHYYSLISARNIRFHMSLFLQIPEAAMRQALRFSKICWQQLILNIKAKQLNLLIEI